MISSHGDVQRNWITITVVFTASVHSLHDQDLGQFAIRGRLSYPGRRFAGTPWCPRREGSLSSVPFPELLFQVLSFCA